MINICIEMCNGKRIYAELYDEIAPKTVSHFMKLVDEKFYDGLIFHRIINGFMSQCGGFYIDNGTLVEKKCEQVEGEFAENGFNNTLNHSLGVLSMARADNPNSATSQFFICDVNCGFLDGKYAAFGKIYNEYESLKNIVQINSVPTCSLSPAFSDFPNASEIDVTIKSIYRI